MSKKSEKVNYEQLGEAIQSVIETGYMNRRRFYIMSFVKGLLAGAGSVVGAALVVTVLLWVLSILHYVPFLHKVTDNLRNSVEQTQTQQR